MSVLHDGDTKHRGGSDADLAAWYTSWGKGLAMAETGTYGYVAVAGSVRAIDGTVSLPSISFANNLTTGFYRVGAGQVGFASAGVLSLTFGAGGLVQGAAAATSLILAGHVTGGVAAQRDVVIQTGNAANPQVLVTRVTFGSNAAEAAITFANSNLVGMKLGANMDANSNGITSVSTLSKVGTSELACAINTSYHVLAGGLAGVAGDGVRITLYGTAQGAIGLLLSTPDAVGGDAERFRIAQNVATAAMTWANLYHVGMKYGLNGTATGAWTMDGATSGVVTMTVSAVAGTWTMTLPAAVGTAGFQLTDSNGAGLCTWTAAASLRELKNINGVLNPQDALSKILAVPVSRFHFKEGMGTGDTDTEYVGVMADEAPWAMHYGGGVLNPINAFGYTVGAIQALYEEVVGLRTELEALKR